VLTATLTAVVCAILQGCRGFDAIGQWLRRGSAPQVLAGLRNAALNLLRLNGRTNISASLRSGTWNLQHVLNLLGIVS
jgi:hypothetical protein